MNDKFQLAENYELNDLKFNMANCKSECGKFKKSGPNTIDILNDNDEWETIVDFGVGELGNVDITDEKGQLIETIPNALYLRGGYNAAEQRKGYGGLGLKFIFHKLTKIQNIILQCYDTACPFWFKQGGEEIYVKENPGGHPLRTLRISRDSFY
jgi:hypothetical protein